MPLTISPRTFPVVWSVTQSSSNPFLDRDTLIAHVSKRLREVAPSSQIAEGLTAARLSLARVQLVECALQLFKLLSSLAELSFRRQALVVGKIFGGFRDERIEIDIRRRLGRRLRRCGGYWRARRRLRGDCSGGR